MKSTLTLLIIALVGLTNAVAQTGATPAKVPQAVKAQAKPSGKPAAKSPQAKGGSSTALPSLLDPADLTNDQLSIAEKVYTGEIACDMDTKVTLTPDVPTPGRFLLQMGSDQYLMTPVITTTGAVRLENQWSGAVWIQVANKSMLINNLTGTRLADGCAHAEQLAVAQRLASSTGLID